MTASKVLGAAMAAALVGSVAVWAQNSGPVAGAGSLAAQVRSIQGDLSRAIDINTRAQVIIGRLASQDARVAAVTLQVVDAQRALLAATSSRIDAETEIRKLALIQPGSQPQARAASPQELAEQRQVLANRQREEQLAQMRLVALQKSLDTEQAKRTEIGMRLDDLERSLAQPRP